MSEKQKLRIAFVSVSEKVERELRSHNDPPNEGKSAEGLECGKMHRGQGQPAPMPAQG